MVKQHKGKDPVWKWQKQTKASKNGRNQRKELLQKQRTSKGIDKESKASCFIPHTTYEWED